MTNLFRKKDKLRTSAFLLRLFKVRERCMFHEWADMQHCLVKCSDTVVIRLRINHTGVHPLKARTEPVGSKQEPPKLCF